MKGAVYGRGDRRSELFGRHRGDHPLGAIIGRRPSGWFWLQLPKTQNGGQLLTFQSHSPLHSRAGTVRSNALGAARGRWVTAWPHRRARVADAERLCDVISLSTKMPIRACRHSPRCMRPLA